MRCFFAGLWILALSGWSYADAYMRQPAVDIIRYEIALELTDTSDSITATTKIHVRMRKNGVSGMRLDFTGLQLDGVSMRGSRRPYQYRDGALAFDFDRAYKRDDIAIVEVRYHGIPERGLLIGKNRYGRRVFFSENWPDRARHWIPSIDHPSDKAAVRMTVTAPNKYSVVSNGRRAAVKPLRNGRTLTQWVESKAIPTYSIALGVAEFAILPQKDAASVPMEWYSYPEDSVLAARKFQPTAAAMEYFSSLIGPYPYEKLAQVQASVSFWGMENSSAIFYSESSIQDAAHMEDPVIHEVAHQWFGNSVTQSDWDHLWLSEGFATYLEALFYEHRHGPGAMRQIMTEHARRLKESDSSDRPIIDPDQTDATKKLNLANYQKGAWILHMLRGMMGDAAFFEGLRLYYRRHEGGTALSEDFQKALESAWGAALDGFFRQWLYQSGWPEYRISWQWDPGTGMVDLKIDQAQSNGLFDMPLDIVFVSENRRESRRLRIAERTHSFRIPQQEMPLSIEADPHDRLLKTLSITKQ